MKLKIVIYNTAMNAYIFREYFEYFIPLIDKKNITVTVSKDDINIFKDENKVFEILKTNGEVYIELLLNNNVSVIVVQIFHNGYKYTTNGDLSELFKISESNVKILFSLLNQSKK